MNSEKTSIIIVHKDDSRYLNIYIQSILACSIENEYEIIVVDNESEKQESHDFLEKLGSLNIKVIKIEKSVSYKNAVLRGVNSISDDSGYLIFSHSDNVVLTHKWLDFMLDLCFKDSSIGLLSVNPLLDYMGASGSSSGPNYNFIFTPRNIFFGVNQFAFFPCDHVGVILGYAQQIGLLGKKSLLISDSGFLHHYSRKSIKQEDKNSDVQKFNEFSIEFLSKNTYRQA